MNYNTSKPASDYYSYPTDQKIKDHRQACIDFGFMDLEIADFFYWRYVNPYEAANAFPETRQQCLDRIAQLDIDFQDVKMQIEVQNMGLNLKERNAGWNSKMAQVLRSIKTAISLYQNLLERKFNSLTDAEMQTTFLQVLIGLCEDVLPTDEVLDKLKDHYIQLLNEKQAGK